MTPEESFRRLRDAGRWYPLEPARMAEAPQPLRRFAPVRLTVPVIATAVVAIVLAALTIAVLQIRPVGDPAAPRPSASPSGSPALGTVGALPAVDGRLIATWTSDRPAPKGPFDLKGDAYEVTQSCTGGGTLLIDVVDRKAEGEICTASAGSSPSGFIDDDPAAERTPIDLRVAHTGSPVYAVQLWAVSVKLLQTRPAAPGPTVAKSGPGVPASLRTCGAEDLAATGTFTPSTGIEGGAVTLRSVATTDCAIRSWPTLHYLDAHGAAVGPAAGKSYESARTTTGERFAPARVAAGSSANLSVVLFHADRLRAAPACYPRTVTALQIGLAGGIKIRVPVPTEPARANCITSNSNASGVGPVQSSR